MYFFNVTVVPLPVLDFTISLSVKHCIIENPIPLRSSLPEPEYIGSRAFSISSIPRPLSCILTITRPSSCMKDERVIIFFLSSEIFVYAWTMQFVTASETAVLISHSSSIVGSSCAINAVISDRENASLALFAGSVILKLLMN